MAVRALAVRTSAGFLAGTVVGELNTGKVGGSPQPAPPSLPVPRAPPGPPDGLR